MISQTLTASHSGYPRFRRTNSRSTPPSQVPPRTQDLYRMAGNTPCRQCGRPRSALAQMQIHRQKNAGEREGKHTRMLIQSANRRMRQFPKAQPSKPRRPLYARIKLSRTLKPVTVRSAWTLPSRRYQAYALSTDPSSPLRFNARDQHHTCQVRVAYMKELAEAEGEVTKCNP